MPQKASEVLISGSGRPLLRPAVAQADRYSGRPILRPKRAACRAAGEVNLSALTRPVATDPGLSPKNFELLEREYTFLRAQVDKKDEQISALLERDRESNYLVQGLQRMLGPLARQAARRRRPAATASIC